MHTISFEQFKIETSLQHQQLKTLIEKHLPIIIGKEAVDHFTQNFEKQSWERTPWQEVKRRQSWTREYKYNLKHHKARLSRPILGGDTGNLKRSLQYTTKTNGVLIHSDLIYAAVHNYGGHAGRGSGFQMPKRQFIGDSPELKKHIENIIRIRISKILQP